MTARTLIITTATLLALATIYIYSTSFQTVNMVTQPQIPLRIFLAPLPPATIDKESPPSLHLRVTFENTSPQPISFLSWSTPFDQLAPAMGVFIVKPIPSPSDDTDPEPLKTLNLRPNRRIPTSKIFPADDNSIISIKARDSITKDVVLKEPEVVGLTKEQRYKVGVSGQYHGVWVGSQELSVKEGSSLLRGSFEVEGVEVSSS